jgi:hypothetical protein
MQLQCSTWQAIAQRMATFAMLVTCTLAGCDNPPPATAPSAKNDLPNPLSKETVEPWKNAGAQVGWTRVGRGFHFELGPENWGGEGPKSGDLPALSFRPENWKEGVLRKLPAPTTAFGLHLVGIELTDADLKDLVGLKHLQKLELTHTKVTDAGLKELIPLQQLQSLGLGFNQVTDAGLKELAGLKNLQVLDLWGTNVTDAGLKELAALKSLQEQYLTNTKVTDGGLEELVGLNSLQKLELDGTQVTDAALKKLASLKNLQSLNLSLTKVTDAGVKELQEALPGCKISR